MNYVLIGKFVNTHGIKGELRILSNFEKKERVFITQFKLYVGKEKQEVEITHYRPHKEFDMVTLKGYENINDVLKFKGEKVYINKNDLKLTEDEYLYEDLIGLNIVEDKPLGIVKDVINNNNNILLQIESEKNFYIPLHSEYIKKIDIKNKTIYTENGRDLII